MKIATPNQEIQVRPFHRGPFHAFSVRDPLTGQARHFSSEEAAQAFAARLEIARADPE